MPPAAKKPPEPVEGTYLESDDEIRQAIKARRARLAAKPAAPAQPGKPPPLVPPPPPLVEASPARPTQRPSLGLLCICDDGKQEGEWVRLRADRYVIGRAEGDIRIPHDGLMSGRHAELVRQQIQPGCWRWTLVDLKSTNGTFVRIGKTILREGMEFLMGAGHYRFETSTATVAYVAQSPAPAQTIPPRGMQPAPSFGPTLVELVQGKPTQRFHLTLPEIWLGRDPQTCNIARRDDLLTSPRHARLFRDARGQWFIENQKSLNGLWLRIKEEMPLGGTCQFRLGEQVFLFQVP